MNYRQIGLFLFFFSSYISVFNTELEDDEDTVEVVVQPVEPFET